LRALGKPSLRCSCRPDCSTIEWHILVLALTLVFATGRTRSKVGHRQEGLRTSGVVQSGSLLVISELLYLDR